LAKGKAWVVAVDMGYGHQRAAYPFKDLAIDRIINANSDRLLSAWELRAWRRYQSFYEGVSRLSSIPFVGPFIFNAYDRLQRISDFYPFRDLSRPNLAALICRRLIEKKGLNKSMMNYLRDADKSAPLITTFFFTALAAEHAGIREVYCVVTDSDISRIWVGADPKKSRIKYLAPCEQASKRLKEYGVSDDRILLTGFPLPKENTGTGSLYTLKADLGKRLANLNPGGRHRNLYYKLARQVLGRHYKNKAKRALTITFCVGGAGAQTVLGFKVLKSLSAKIKDGSVCLNISVGTRLEVLEYFKSKIHKLGLEGRLGSGVKIIFALSKQEYFKQFNESLRTTDVLWTKPSELSFYTALGLPIIIAPPIGAHEFRNQRWLVELGSGFVQENPEFAAEWLMDLVISGKLADAAIKGFIEAPKSGALEIESIVFASKRRR
jgi:hypothetical protein